MINYKVNKKEFFNVLFIVISCSVQIHNCLPANKLKHNKLHYGVLFSASYLKKRRITVKNKITKHYYVQKKGSGIEYKTSAGHSLHDQLAVNEVVSKDIFMKLVDRNNVE